MEQSTKYAEIANGMVQTACEHIELDFKYYQLTHKQFSTNKEATEKIEKMETDIKADHTKRHYEWKGTREEALKAFEW